MITVRKASARGHFDHGWLDTHHTFSFGDYYDAAQMGFGDLRVINEDRVAAGKGFGTHGHRDMEILTYVLQGALAHRDSTGGGSTLRPGDVQRMTAGRGVQHSEFNGSETEPAHFLQIWIVPGQRGLPPSYEERRFEPAERRNQLRLVASPGAQSGSLALHQDARVYAALLDPHHVLTHTLSERRAWIQVARGEITVNGQRLEAGDGAGIEGEAQLSIAAAGTAQAELLLFDLR